MPDSYTLSIDRSGFDLKPYCQEYRHTCDFMGRAADGLTCKLWAEDVTMLRLATKPLLQVVFSVNGAQQFRGQIDVQTIGEDGTITLSCSDYLSNAVDSSVGRNLFFTKNDSLRTVILKLMQSQQITKVVSGWNDARNAMAGRAVFTAAPLIDFASKKLTSDERVKQEDGIWETVDRICKKHNCCPKSGVDKNTIYLVAPEYRQPISYSVTRLIKEKLATFRGTAKRDYSRFPTVFIATGQAGDSTEFVSGAYFQVNPFNDLFEETGEVQNIARDSDRPNVLEGRFDYLKGSIPPGVVYREMHITEKNSRTQSELESVAMRRLSESVKESLMLSGEVDGHTIAGQVVTADTIVGVTDEVTGVFENLWISGRDLAYQGGKQTASFDAIRPVSMTLNSIYRPPVAAPLQIPTTGTATR